MCTGFNTSEKCNKIDGVYKVFVFVFLLNSIFKYYLILFYCMPEKTSKKKVIVYSTPQCPYCKMAKEFLKENKVAYEDIDVSKDEKAAEKMIEKSGQMGVPVIDIEGNVIVGFDKEKIKKALKIK